MDPGAAGLPSSGVRFSDVGPAGAPYMPAAAAALSLGANADGSTVPSVGITHHGGPTLGTSNVYLLFYGNGWVADSKAAASRLVLVHFTKALQGSGWYNTVTSYTDTSK